MLLQRDYTDRKLAQRAGPVLSDGTRFKDLFDLEKREVALRVMRDPEIHALEMERIFGRAWIVVGHDSEIPNPGDFMVRPIGEDPAIVTRATDGSINILLNVCAHRGMEVCFAEKGNASQFKCPYHAWVYDGTGRLLGVPFEKEMYGAGWDKSQYGLPRVNVAVRHGVIFGNLSKTPVPLEDYLGDMLWYFDVLFAGRDWVAFPNSQGRNLIPANWKANLDQNHGDVLHTVGAHHDFAELGLFAQDFGQYTTKVHTPPRGHYLSLFEPDFGDMGQGGGVNQTKEMMEARKAAPLNERGWAFLLYPSTFGGAFALPLPDGSKVRVASFMMHVPHGVDRFEFGAYGMTLAPRDTPPEALSMVLGFGDAMRGISGGQFEDNEAWRSITKAARGPATRKSMMKYLSFGTPNKPEGWEGPGVVYDGFSRDDTQWHGWLHYYDIMTADEG